MPIPKEVQRDFFHSWSPPMAYVLGFFAADGTLTQTKRGGKYIAFHITDRGLLEDIRGVMGSNHKIATRVRDPRWKLGYRLQIGSKELYGDIERLGFTTNKSVSMEMPDVPQAYIGEFVRGYFDGDGCVYFNTLTVKGRKKPKHILQTKFTSGSEVFLKGLLEVLQQGGKVAGGYIVTKERGFELAFSHRDSLALYRLMYNNAPTCGLWLPRKKRKFDRAIRIMYAGVA